MPYMAEEKIEAGHLKPGDIGTLGDGIPSWTIKNVDVKTKWVRLTFTDGTETRVRVNDEVTVLREKTTQAEMDNAWHSQSAHHARVAIDEADRLVQEAKQKLLDDLDYRPDYHRWAYANYVEAQTKRKIWIDVAKLAKVDDMGLVEAMRRIMENLTDEIVRYRHESRSTSDLANSVENIERDVKTQWVDLMKFHVPPRLGR